MVFRLDDSAKKPFEKITGKYISKTYKQKVKIKYNSKTGQVKMFPVFFKGYSLEYIGGNIYKVRDDNIYIRFFNESLTIGNDWVFDLVLKKLN